MQLLLIFALVFALGVAVFAVQNATPVEISFLFYEFYDISLVVVILVSVLIGALIVFLLSVVKQISYLRKVRSLEKRIEQLEQESKQIAPKDDIPDQVTDYGSEENISQQNSVQENSSEENSSQVS